MGNFIFRAVTLGCKALPHTVIFNGAISDDDIKAVHGNNDKTNFKMFQIHFWRKENVAVRMDEEF